MADYIRRDIVLDIINTMNDTGGFAGYADYCTLFDEIDTMPAADVKRVKRGRWIDIHEYCKMNGYIPSGVAVYYWCSECMKEQEKTSNFCPNCGADMREHEPIKG